LSESGWSGWKDIQDKDIGYWNISALIDADAMEINNPVHPLILGILIQAVT
jgi:hypothetical protein